MKELKRWFELRSINLAIDVSLESKIIFSTNPFANCASLAPLKLLHTKLILLTKNQHNFKFAVQAIDNQQRNKTWVRQERTTVAGADLRVCKCAILLPLTPNLLIAAWRVVNCRDSKQALIRRKMHPCFLPTTIWKCLKWQRLPCLAVTLSRLSLWIALASQRTI